MIRLCAFVLMFAMACDDRLVDVGVYQLTFCRAEAR